MEKYNKRKPIIMLHNVSPNKVGGPNVSNERIKNSELKNKYNFEILVQEKPAGGKLNLKLINTLRKRIKKVKPDILHLSGLQSSAFHAVIAAKLAGCKNILITIRGFSGDDMKIPSYKRWLFNKIIEPITLILADGVLGNSSYTANREIVKKYAKNRLGYIYNFPPENKKGISSHIRNSLRIHLRQ